MAAAGVCAAALWPGSPVRFAAASVLQYKACDLTVTPGGVVALGDSITAGHHQAWLSLGASDSYFDVLACAQQIPATANMGVWMQTTEQIRERIPAVIDADPSAVLLMAGTNDIRQGAADQTVDNIADMVAALDAANIRVLVGLLPPSDDYPAQTIATNADLLAWATEQGVETFDAYSGLAAIDGTYADGMSEDGIHPSREGATVVADAALSAYAG